MKRLFVSIVFCLNLSSAAIAQDSIDFSKAYSWLLTHGRHEHFKGAVQTCIGEQEHDVPIRQQAAHWPGDSTIYGVAINMDNRVELYFFHYTDTTSYIGTAWLASSYGKLQKTCVVHGPGNTREVDNNLYREEFEAVKRNFIKLSKTVNAPVIP